MSNHPWKWQTPEQEKFNAEHKPCARCRGKGYVQSSPNIGCYICLGLGVVRNHQQVFQQNGRWVIKGTGYVSDSIRKEQESSVHG